MAYEDFLSAFAQVQGIDSVDALLNEHAQQYSFQIQSRDRAKRTVEFLREKLDLDLSGARVLDIDCTFGALAVEFAKVGAEVVGIDNNQKWLRLAEANARGEVEARFLKCDVAARSTREDLEPYGKFDLVIVNEAFGQVYDTIGLLDSLTGLLAPQGRLYFRIPNGRATRTVLQSGPKRLFGTSLLPPDHLPMFTPGGAYPYFRRWQYFSALFASYGLFSRMLNEATDPDVETTKRHILADVTRIKRGLKAENFDTPQKFRLVRIACRDYLDELAEDMYGMEWDPLFLKYRPAVWEGVLQRSD